MTKTVVVIGAGVIGLSSAVAIKQAIPEVDVTLVADKFSPDTTSDGSAGFWEPFALGDTDIGWIRETSAATYQHLKQLAYSSQASQSGASVLSGYSLARFVRETPDFFHDLVDGYRQLSPKELEPFPEVKSGYFFTTMQVDVSTYLPWLTNQFLSMGGKVKQAKVTSLRDMVGQYDLVINCCGIGARTLVNDRDVIPIRGQVFRIRAPWVKHFYFYSDGASDHVPEAYILPGTSSVVVGGTAEVGEWDTTPSEETARKIWKAATKVLPQLEPAEVLTKWVGLRPGRSSVRLERDVVASAYGLLPVIHNYGHGGAGVTLHWGCALKVVELVRKEFGGKKTQTKQPRKSKL